MTAINSCVVSPKPDTTTGTVVLLQYTPGVSRFSKSDKSDSKVGRLRSIEIAQSLWR